MRGFGGTEWERGTARFSLPLRLSTTDQQFRLNHSEATKETLDPGASIGVALVVELPCSGSTGAGVAMGFSYVFTATL